MNKFAYYRNFLMSSCFQFVLNVKIFGTYSIISWPQPFLYTICMYVLWGLESSWIWFSSLVDHPLGKLKFQILICSRFTRHSVALCLPNHDQYYGLGHSGLAKIRKNAILERPHYLSQRLISLRRSLWGRSVSNLFF